MVGGNVALRGDTLADVDMPNFVPRYGKLWTDVVHGGTVRIDTDAGLPPSARRIVCQTVLSKAALIGFEVPVSGDVGMGSEPLDVVIVYRASKPVAMKVIDRTDSIKGEISLGTLPPTTQLRTFIKVDIRAGLAKASTTTLTMDAIPSDFFELHRAGLADGRLAHGKGRGNLTNLGLI